VPPASRSGTAILSQVSHPFPHPQERKQAYETQEDLEGAAAASVSCQLIASLSRLTEVAEQCDQVLQFPVTLAPMTYNSLFQRHSSCVLWFCAGVSLAADD